MADKKILNTRIKLKYDTLQNWQDSKLILGAGEVAFASVPTVEGSTLEPVMFKVGDGSKTFSQLTWASATAADVHGWAKENLNQFNARVNALINGALNGSGTATIKGYVTESDFNTFKTTLEAWKSGITNAQGTGRLDVIEKDYTTAAQAEAKAKAAADAVLGTDKDAATANTVYGAKAAAKAAQDKADDNATDIAAIQTAISKLDETYATDAQLTAAKNALQANIDKKVAQSDYNTQVEALGNEDERLAGLIGGHETRIAGLETVSATHATKNELNTAVAGLKAGQNDTFESETIAGAKKYADKKIEDFTKAYIEDTADNTINTLNEIAAWIADDEAGAAKVIQDVEGLKTSKLNVSDFNTFKTTDFKTVSDKAHTHGNFALLETYTQTEANLADAVAKKHSHASDMVEVTPAMKTAWDKVSEKATASDLNSHTTNKNNPHGVTAAQVGAYTTGQADGKFATLTAFESDKTTVKEATHAGTADSATTAASATKATKDGNDNVISSTYETITNVNNVKSRVKAIEDDYLKAADEFIIDCGSSSKNIFDFPNA